MPRKVIVRCNEVVKMTLDFLKHIAVQQDTKHLTREKSLVYEILQLRQYLRRYYSAAMALQNTDYLYKVFSLHSTD